MTEILRIAVQKKGRLSDKSKDLLKDCGLEFTNGANQLKGKCYNFPIELLYLRDDDIPGYVADGVADIGIVGKNVVLEKDKDVIIEKELGFAKCRLSIAVPERTDYLSPFDLEGKTIATSYPKIVQMFLEEKGVNAKTHEISGSVEIAPTIGLTEAICDIVSTGSTLLSNGLKEVETVMRSEAVVVSNRNLSGDKANILFRLFRRINSVQAAKNNKYILLNAPDDSVQNIIDILPGMMSPTILPLAESGWSSVHSVIAESEFWEKIEQLKEAGAQGILVVPIEKMIM